MGRLEGKTAIITGGTKGLGEAAARRFVREGARVVIAGRSEEDGRRLEAELGEGCLFFRLDVTDYENWKECIAFVRERLGRLDILINNAGISVAENIAEAIEASRPVLSLTAERDGEEFQEDVPSERFDETLVDVVALREAISGLEENDREIIRLRYFAGKTQSFVARTLGMTQVQVSRRERRIINYMREQLIK